MRHGTAIRLAAVWLAASCGGEVQPGSEAPAIPKSPHAPLHFTDVTATSGIDFVLTSGAVPATRILEVKGGGLALLDRDGDGDLDLFVPNGATLEAPERGPGARLFDNESANGEPRFRDATRAARLEFARWGMGAAVGDVDGDGWDDVFVACFGENALLRNTAGTGFDERTAELGLGHAGWGMAAAFGDLDLDGDLDLYLVNYLQLDPAEQRAPMEFLGVQVFPGPVGYDAAPDVLYENRGADGFVDVTAAAGASQPAAFGLGAVIVDLDSDGRQDVFVGNDSMRNFLFRNATEAGRLRFEEVGLASGVAVNADGRAQATMGIAVGDVTGNGLPDLFTTNFASDTNTLHVNRGELNFADRTQPLGLGMVSQPFLGWAAMFVDFDHDADEDLLVFNGHVYPDSVTRQVGMDSLQTPLLFERRGARFERAPAATAGAWLDEAHRDRAAVFGDLDRDGDMDCVVGELGGPLRVLRNDAPREGSHWLAIELHDDGSVNHRALGARVRLRSAAAEDGAWQTRWLVSGPGYQSASELCARFGLGGDAGPVTVELTWPGGATERRLVEGVDRRIVLERE